MSDRSIGAGFDPRHNSLNALRLVLAAMVIVSHAGALTRGDELMVGDRTLGSWAVIGFFFISGFLITRSRLRHSPVNYARDRALRILPAYFVMLAVVAFGFAPLGAAVSATLAWDFSSAVGYVLFNLPLAPPWIIHFQVGDMYTTDLLYKTWNGPIYTLFHEGMAYIVIGLLVGLVPRRWLGRVLLALGALLTAASLVSSIADGVGPGLTGVAVMQGLPFALAFVWGAVAWIYRDKIPLSPTVGAVSLVALVAIALAGQSPALAAFPFGVLLLWAGVALPLQAVGSKRDISYGMYLYGWPVQTLLILAWPRLALGSPVWVNTVVVLTLTAAVALVSCVVVERPALDLKRGLPTRSRSTTS